jgi:hypothetical protein
MKSLFQNLRSVIALTYGHPVLIGSRVLQFSVRTLFLLHQLSAYVRLLVWIHGGGFAWGAVSLHQSVRIDDSE